MHDVIVIGGSYAGLAATLQLARARRSVLVLDTGQRRNRRATAAHGFLGQDGVSPAAIAEKGRAEVLAYPSVTWRDVAATSVGGGSGSFVVRAGDEEHRARRLVLATGVEDELPDVKGLAERWGITVFPCPYCHGYELHRGRLGVLGTQPVSLHSAALVTEWSAPGGTTLFLDGSFEPTEAEVASLVARGVRIERSRVLEVRGDAPRVEVCLEDGRTAELAGLFAISRATPAGSFAEQLGCEVEAGPMGVVLKTDPMKETTVAGVFACGDVASPMPSLAFAVADGVRAGVAAHQSLVFRTDPV